jgi:chromosome segregation protein
MAQHNHNIINQIQQLLNHGVQDINQVLPLLPPITQQLQLQDQKIQNLQASLASSQANCNNLNNLINTNQQVIAQLELDKINLANELDRKKNELDNFQRVNDRIIEDFLSRIIQCFKSELNLSTNDMIAKLMPRFTYLETPLNILKNDIITKIESCTNSLKTKITELDHSSLLENERNTIMDMHRDINKLLLELDNCNSTKQIHHNDLINRIGILKQTYSHFNNSNLSNLLNNVKSELYNFDNQIKINIADNSRILCANIAQNLNSESTNVVNRLSSIVGNNRITNIPQNTPSFNYAIPFNICYSFCNISNVIYKFVEKRPFICFTIITLFILVFLCYF